MEELNHPLLFVFFMLLALTGLSGIFVHLFKRFNMGGPATLMQNT